MFVLDKKFKHLPHHCADTALMLYYAGLELKGIRLSTKNLARR